MALTYWLPAYTRVGGEVRQTVIANWMPSSFFGWGVYGLNLGLALANDPDIDVAFGYPAVKEKILLDPVRLRAMDRCFRQSRQLYEELSARPGAAAQLDVPVLACLAADLRADPSAHGGELHGSPTIGVAFFESANLTAHAVARANSYPLIITGSTWNEHVLRAHGVSKVKTILQGIDPLLFNLAPPVARNDGQFRVFSGGKLEVRKGQDIAMAAFRKFAQRRPDAVLVGVWHSPWPEIARSVDSTGLAAPITFGADGQLDAAGWACANGLRPHQFIDAGKVPNALMPQLLRQMDVALFPNRAEGGTNLVAMEAMACGVPTILSANTGHLDLIKDENCYALSRQGTVTCDPRAKSCGDVSGWGEADVDEVVERLEEAYLNRSDAGRRGERGAAMLAELTWARNAAAMKAAILRFV